MRILTVISNYNEQDAIEAAIADFRSNATIVSDLLVIDNCSADRSFELIKKSGANYLRHPANTGGSAGVIKTALLYADLNDYDIYCHMDGDNQHNARELEKIVQPILDGAANIVIGSRFIKREGFQSLPVRRLAIRTFSWLASRLSGQDITDLTSGFRAYDRRAITFFSRQFKHEFDACVQLLLVAALAGLTIKEVPVLMNPRLTGRSEFNFINSAKFPIFSIVSIVGTMLQRKKIRELSHVTKY